MSAEKPAFNPDTTDLDRMHAAARREAADVPPGQESAPMWVIFAALIVAIAAGGQLGANVSFDFEKSNSLIGVKLPDPRPSDGGPAVALDPLQVAMKKGAATYALCGGCHQGSGQGVPGMFPPLAGSDWVTGGTERLIRVVLHGLSGPITVKGGPFAAPAPMPPQGGVLGDQDVANVATFVRNSWGNKGSLVTKEMVAAVRDAEKARSSPWTGPELDKYAAKDVPGAPAPAAN